MQRYFVFGFFLLFTFLFLSLIVSLNLLDGFDREAMLQIQQVVPRLLDMPLSVFSLLGTAEFVSIIVLILLFVFPILRNIYTLGMYVLTGIIELAFKYFLDHVAPPLELLRTYSFFKLPSGSISHDFFSYPSGHSARTVFVSLLLFILVNKEKGMNQKLKYLILSLIIVFDFFMLASRIYLGEHWFSDVLGGALLGLFLAFFAIYLSYRFNKAHT